MKKYILLVASAIMLAFSSCTDKEEIEINYQVDITINPSTVKSAFKGYFTNGKAYGIDMYKDAELLISAYIYNKDGMYVDKKELHVKDYASTANFSLTIPENEKYTIVTTTYSVMKNGNASSYKIENYDARINDMKITQCKPTGISYYSNWGMLGIKVQEVYPNDRNAIIDVEPASSLIAVQYENIHAFDEDGIDKHMVIFENNDYVQIENNFPCYKNTLPNNAGHTNSVDVTEIEGNRAFEILYLLPKSQMHMEACMYIGEYRINYASKRQEAGVDPSYGYTNIDIKAGNEYVFTIDCSNLAISVEQLSASKSVINHFSEILNVKANLNPCEKSQISNVMTLTNN